MLGVAQHFRLNGGVLNLGRTDRKSTIHKGLEPSFTGRQPVAFPDGKWTVVRPERAPER